MLILFFVVAELSAQESVRFEVSGYGNRHDQTCTVSDPLWKLEHLAAGAAVFIYDRDVMYTVFSMNGVTTMSARCRETEGDARPLMLSLPLGISQGSTVRVVCEPSASVLFRRFL